SKSTLYPLTWKEADSACRPVFLWNAPIPLSWEMVLMPKRLPPPQTREVLRAGPGCAANCQSCWRRNLALLLVGWEWGGGTVLSRAQPLHGFN
uniref:Uncharacterized protein n=1 Tax=Gopherus agassizii TaxID=38772 RepID=A0A452GG72_9SAUR